MNPVIGIFSTLFSVFVVLPLWFYILYNILSSIDVGGTVWMAFAVYMVSRLIAGIALGIGRALDEADN